MTKLQWNNVGERLFETGVDRGVLFSFGSDGVAWDGLVSVSDNSVGSEEVVTYVDGLKVRTQRSPGDFSATLEAFTYPDKFLTFDGTASGMVTGQRRPSFDLSYRTRVGNDVRQHDHGYKIHILYNCQAAPSSRMYDSISDGTQVSMFEWELSSLPVGLNHQKPTSHVVIDSNSTNPTALIELERLLYGTEINGSRIPPIEELFSIFERYATLKVTDEGGGIYLVQGPDHVVTQISPSVYDISWPSVVQIDNETYQISSL